MSEPAKGPSAFDLLVEQIRLVVREEIAAALANGNSAQPHEDKMLTIAEVAGILGGDVDKQIAWLYAHSKKLPFAKRLSRKNLRFSEAGLRRWLAARK
jgi:hypothetical protein